MKPQFRKTLIASSILSASAVITLPSFAQSGDEYAGLLEEIVVTARRRDEGLQDVPITVNAVSSEQIANLNIRHFEDLEGLVPGLTLSEDSLAPNASMRGVKYDTFASGNNATVEFYFNDAPYVSSSVIQAMFDVGQIEVLRGPQGTLRGRASPSGSITITSRDPSLNEFDGYVDVTATDANASNINAAVSIPIVEDVFAVRLAGFAEENDLYEVENLAGEESAYKGSGYRVTALFEPVDAFSAKAYYQKFEPEREPVYQVESAYRADPSKAPPAFSRDISASDRLGTSFRETNSQEHERLGLELSYEFAGQALKYVYADSKFSLERELSDESGDVTGAALGTNDPALIAAWYPVGQLTKTTQDSEAHELRLQSAEPLFGFMDYVVGAFKLDNIPDTFLLNPTLIENLDSGSYFVARTPITSINKAFEESYYGNLSFRLGETTELSVGGRYIEYREERLLDVGVILIGPGSVLGNDGKTTNYADIYSASLKHNFSDTIMGYVNYGTSWRGPAASIGDFSALKSANQLAFADTDPEESRSFEVGVRSEWMGGRLRLNGSLYKQSFDDYVYRAPGDGVYYNSYGVLRDPNTGAIIGVAPSVQTHNFISGVPIDVFGLELEAKYLANENLELGAQLSYSKGEIDSGVIPCNDLDGNGVPDAYVDGAPSVADIEAVNGGNFFLGGENVSSCVVDFRANDAPLWNATLTSDYSFEVAGFDGFVRGLWTFYGESKNDPINPLDDVDAYNLLNLFVGIADREVGWEVQLFAKNLFDTEEVLEREQFPGSVTYQQLSGGAVVNQVTLNSDYRQIQITKAREVGVNFRYTF
ncbi:TonB-dependent receptor [Halioxenophilus sp. WMMB6]|uniref:TonB-dependent receptor n=1 Tax=Halioxenophilus sp. WMMB6 TaxID=3073815 RepID=UPI00295E2946|nr:TonB-dependent receptor [Halioxenophilus sp. WMMB6]